MERVSDNMEIITDFKNNLLNRKEVVFSIDSAKNPGLAKVREDCSKHFNAEADRIAVKKISSNFGSKEFLIEAYIYDSAADKLKVEPKPKPKKEKK